MPKKFRYNVNHPTKKKREKKEKKEKKKWGKTFLLVWIGNVIAVKTRKWKKK